MPYVFQTTEKRTGKPHPLWRYQYYDHLGRKRKGTGTTSRRETEKIAAQVQGKQYSIRSGAAPAPRRSDKIYQIQELVDEYLRWGETQGGRGNRPWSSEHAHKRRMYLAWWQEELGLKTQIDLLGCQIKVERVIQRIVRERNRSGKTAWNRTESLVALCNWLADREYLETNPLARLRPINTAPRVIRRALHSLEIQAVLTHAIPEHRIVYETAMCSGLRAGELRRLVVSDVDLERGGLQLHAEWTKNRKPGLQPVPRWLLEKLLVHAAGKPRNAPLLWVPTNIDRTYKEDLVRAGVPRVTEEGKADFHALRVLYVSLLDACGASAKTSMDLARHSTPTLTMAVYARANQDRLRGVVEDVGQLVAPGAAPQLNPNGSEAPLAVGRKTA